MIASHYVEPVGRCLLAPAELREAPTEDSAIIVRLAAGTAFDLLDDTLGWAWGYAGRDRRVGYVESAKIAAHRQP